MLLHAEGEGCKPADCHCTYTTQDAENAVALCGRLNDSGHACSMLGFYDGLCYGHAFLGHQSQSAKADRVGQAEALDELHLKASPLVQNFWVPKAIARKETFEKPTLRDQSAKKQEPLWEKIVGWLIEACFTVGSILIVLLWLFMMFVYPILNGDDSPCGGGGYTGAVTGADYECDYEYEP